MLDGLSALAGKRSAGTPLCDGKRYRTTESGLENDNAGTHLMLVEHIFAVQMMAGPGGRKFQGQFREHPGGQRFASELLVPVKV